MRAFADKHGHDFVGLSFDEAPCGRPPAWTKLVAISAALSDHEEALWIDTDVAIVDDSEDISVPEGYWQALVEHETTEGSVPNTGVWLVTRKMLPVITTAAMLDAAVNHRWWDQAAILLLMGYSVFSPICKRVVESPLVSQTLFLPEQWNVWSGSDKSVTPKFRHACGLHGDGEQLQALTEWLK